MTDHDGPDDRCRAGAAGRGKPQPVLSEKGKAEARARKERLAKALRENLRRRKGQQANKTK